MESIDQGAYGTIPVQIPTGATGLSAAVDIGGYRHMTILVPSDWVTATSITFQMCGTATGTFLNVYDEDGNEVSVTVAASRAVVLSSEAMTLMAGRFIKLRSGPASAAVDQTNSPTLTLVLKG